MVTIQGKRWANLYPFIILGIGAIIGEISAFIAGIINQDYNFYIAGFIYGIILFPIFVGISNFFLQRSMKIKDSQKNLVQMSKKTLELHRNITTAKFKYLSFNMFIASLLMLAGSWWVIDFSTRPPDTGVQQSKRWPRMTSFFWKLEA